MWEMPVCPGFPLSLPIDPKKSTFFHDVGFLAALQPSLPLERTLPAHEG